MREPVLLSTDIGSDIDDALSLLVALNAGIDLKGVYTVNGDVVARAAIVRHLINLHGKSVEVGLGEAMPISLGVVPYSFHGTEMAYVDNSFIDEEETELQGKEVFRPLHKVGIEEKGLEGMVRRLSNATCSVFSIGPLTNIARLLEMNSPALRNIKELYVMGCRFKEDSQEHNVRHDIEAARRVFASDIPITVVPGDLCLGYKMPVRQLDSIESPAGAYVKRMARGFIGAKIANDLLLSGFGELTKDSLITAPGTKYLGSLPVGERMESYDRARKLATNLTDSFFAAYQPDDFFRIYHDLIGLLRNKEKEYLQGNAVATILELAAPKDIMVSDVYVPYCFLRHDKLRIERTNVSISGRGNSIANEGNKHKIVSGLDLEDFRRFVEQYVR